MHLALRSYFQKYSLDAFLISDLLNVRYLTGFTGTNGLVLVTKRASFFFTDFRYRQQAAKQISKEFTIVEIKLDLWQDAATLLKKKKIKYLGFEAGDVRFSRHAHLKKILRGVTLIPVAEASNLLRMIKSDAEIKLLTHAMHINKLALAATLPFIQPGKTEMEIKTILECNLLKNGAEKIAFDTIVASGSRGALPHGVASDKKIKTGELITIDFGGVYRGYHADETVTILLGDKRDLSLTSPLLRRGGDAIPPRLRRGEGAGRGLNPQLTLYQIVFDAQAKAIALAKPGVRCSALDKAARGYIIAKGYGDYFGHALGHGVGLEVHERPVLSANSPDILTEGMIFTIEPGIYIPRFGGVRIEDVFVCTANGVRRLSKINKKLKIL